MVSHPSYRGSPNYRRFYNNEVREFFLSAHGRAKSLVKGEVEYGLGPSTISATGVVSKDERKSPLKHNGKNKTLPAARARVRADYSGTRGTFWNAQEKEVFFTWLARVSIHRAELIVEQLPNKSLVEVLNYYHVLRRDLQRLKRKIGPARTQHHKVTIRMNSHQQPFVHTYTVQKTHDQLVSMKDLPIAYEMSSRFIAMEEIQAALLLEKELKVVNEGHRNFIKQLDAYDVEATTNTLNRRGKLKKKLAGHGDQITATADTVDADPQLLNPTEENKNLETSPEAQLLISIDNCHKMTNRMFREYYFPASTRFIKVHYPPLMLLERLVELYTKSLILKMMRFQELEHWQGSSYSLEFTIDDVQRASSRSQNQQIVYYQPSTIAPNKNSPAGSSNSDDEEFETAASSIESDSETDSTFESEARIVIEGMDDFIDPQTESLSTPSAIGPLHISQLPQNRPASGIRPETTINRLINEHLHVAEAEQLENHDLISSRNYEHILLTALTTYQEGQSDVEKSMFDIDTAFGILDEQGFAPLGDTDNIETDANAPPLAQVTLDDILVSQFMHTFSEYSD